jgi:hypothetical protein
MGVQQALPSRRDWRRTDLTNHSPFDPRPEIPKDIPPDSEIHSATGLPQAKPSFCERAMAFADETPSADADPIVTPG